MKGRLSGGRLDLKRGKPLRRKTELRSTKPMKRTGFSYSRYPPEFGTGPFKKPRSPLKAMSAKKRAERKEDSERVRKEGMAFRAAIVGRWCVVCGRNEMQALAETGHGHQAHHGVSQERLKKAGLRALLWDPRNAVPVCEEPCHRRHTDGVEKIKLSALPDSVGEFAVELGLEQTLVRDYAAL